MIKRLVFLAFLILSVSLSCSLPVMVATPTPRAVSQLLVTADPNATATPTPFQPVGPTATPEPTETPNPTEPPPTATPESSEEIPTVPAPIPMDQPLPSGVVNMLVMGSDFRPASGFRTDVIMLVSINPKKGSVSVVSFPRDLYVTIPGWMEQRINTAFPHGGFGMMADTLEYNFGVRPSYYVMTNFQGFTGIVDNLGGVNVNVGSYLSDSCDLPQAVNGYCTVYPGTVWMDGSTALWYVRSRYSTSDFDRARRQQEVLYAMFVKLMSLNAVSRMPELYTMYRNSVETNMSVSDLLPFIQIAPNVLADSSHIHRYSVGPGETYPFITSSGAMVLLPNYDAIRAIIQQAVFNP